MMHMTLYWSRYVTLLVDSWKTDSYLSYFLTLLACFLFASFYQYMEDRRIRFTSSITTTSTAPSDSSASAPLLKLSRVHGALAARIGSAMLFGVNSAIGYVLMLAIMSFNGGVFVAIILGLAFGYGVFRCEEKEIVNVENPCACA